MVKPRFLSWLTLGKSPSGQWDTQSTAVALQNLLLAAHAAGLGTVWTDGVLVKEAEINALLKIEGRKLVAVVPLGYPDEIPRVPPQKKAGCSGWDSDAWDMVLSAEDRTPCG